MRKPRRRPTERAGATEPPLVAGSYGFRTSVFGAELPPVGMAALAGYLGAHLVLGRRERLREAIAHHARATLARPATAADPPVLAVLSPKHAARAAS